MKLKLIFVKPGEKLSLQLHHHRSEHWVVVSGTAKIEIDKNEKLITESKVYIPLGSKHRLMNPGKIPLLQESKVVHMLEKMIFLDLKTNMVI